MQLGCFSQKCRWPMRGKKDNSLRQSASWTRKCRYYNWFQCVLALDFLPPGRQRLPNSKSWQCQRNLCVSKGKVPMLLCMAHSRLKARHIPRQKNPQIFRSFRSSRSHCGPLQLSCCRSEAGIDANNGKAVGVAMLEHPSEDTLWPATDS